MRSPSHDTRRPRGILRSADSAASRNSVTLGRGGDISQKTGHFNLDHPVLQFSDPVAARLGAEFTNIDVGVGGTGPIALEKYY